MRSIHDIIAVALAASLIGSCAAETARYPDLQYPVIYGSVSDPDGVDGLLVNPASLKAFPEFEATYYHSFNDSTFDGDNGIALSQSGAGFAYHHLQLTGHPAVNSWTIGAGSSHGGSFLLGTTYTFFKTNRDGYHNDHFWKLGVLLRPNGRVSIGAVADNINRMEFEGLKTRRVYTGGLGIRTQNDKLTFAVDYTMYEKERFSEGSLTGFATARLANGIVLRGHWKEQGAVGFGLSISFGKYTLAGYSNLDGNRDFQSGISTVNFSSSSRGWAFGQPTRRVSLTISGSYPEERAHSFLWKKGNRTFGDLMLGLDRIRDDDKIGSLSIVIDHPGIGIAQLEELRKKIVQIRNSGKRVDAFLAPMSGLGSYYLASAADRVAMREMDVLNIIGLMAEVTFYGRTLDKLGIDAQIERVGDYKSAPEAYTGDSMSIYQREAINALLDDYYQTLVEAISESRGLTTGTLKMLVDNAPLTSYEALDEGLVDTILFADQFEDWATKSDDHVCAVDFEEYSKEKEYKYGWEIPGRVAVVPAEGSITQGHSGSNPITGKTMGSETISSVIRKARTDKSIKAIVLRVNSPGGEVIGSRAIWRELQLAQEDKPVIVSMSNVAASGGYHISSASDYIFSSETTTTGSIGVYYGKADLSGLREKLGLSTYHLKRGKNADFYSWNVGYSEEQRRKARKLVELAYDGFVSTVADNRGMSEQEVDGVAQGRVWSGRRAVDNHLVDQIGGLDDAIDYACLKAGVARDEIEVEILPTRQYSVLPELKVLALLSDFAGSVLGSSYSNSELTFNLGPADGLMSRLPYDIVLNY